MLSFKPWNIFLFRCLRQGWLMQFTLTMTISLRQQLVLFCRYESRYCQGSPAGQACLNICRHVETPAIIYYLKKIWNKKFWKTIVEIKGGHYHKILCIFIHIFIIIWKINSFQNHFTNWKFFFLLLWAFPWIPYTLITT